MDPQGIVSTWNPGAERFKGYNANEIIGQHFYTEDDQKASLPNRALETARSQGKHETEGWRVRKDGSRFWAYVIIDPIRNHSGEVFAKIAASFFSAANQSKTPESLEEQSGVADQ